MADSSRLPTYKMYAIGWIAALDKELTAALAMLDEIHQQPEDFDQNDKDSNTYSWGRIGHHNIVIASLGGGNYGLVSAATTANYMATSLPHLRFGLMVGIGAGVPAVKQKHDHYEVDNAKDIRLGDIVVSQPANGHAGVIQYDFGKQNEDEFKRVGALAPPPRVLLTALNTLKARQRSEGSQVPAILANAIQNRPRLGKTRGNDSAFIHQGTENDRLFESTSVHVPSDESRTAVSPTAISRVGSLAYHGLQLALVWVWHSIYFLFILSQETRRNARRQQLVQASPSDDPTCQAVNETKSCPRCEKEVRRPLRPDQDPEVHYGTIASGNLVIKDGVFRDQIPERLGTEVLCYEMEAAGLLNDFPCLVIRGICDYADSHKNDRWQNYAAIVAVAYAKELLGIINPKHVERAEQMEQIMTALAGDLSRIDTTTRDTQEAVRNMNRESQAEKIANWLSAPDPHQSHKQASDQHHLGTGQWLLQCEQYQLWKKAPTSSLWLYGIPGCGKTILTSVIINDLKSLEADGRHVLYFYFTFTNIEKQSLDGAVRSLIYQLYCKSKPAQAYLTSIFCSEYKESLEQPSTTQLCEIFDRMTQESDHVWIVLDALDECQLGSTFKNDRLLRWLECISTSEQSKHHLVVTSRLEHNIQVALNKCFKYSICLKSEAISDDILSFIDMAVGTWDGRGTWRTDGAVQKQIREHLAKNAKGMFRWVSCQLDALAPLQGLQDHEAVQETLGSLPRTLEETYERILIKIPDVIQLKAQRILQFLLHSAKPILLTEAAEIIKTSPKAERPEGRINHKLKPDMDSVTLYCPNLVEVVSLTDKNVTKQYLQLAHASVKDYLLSNRLTERIPRAFRAPHLSKGYSQASMAEVCLAYLLDIKTSQSPKAAQSSHPLALHAAEYWVQYARQAGNDMNLVLIREFVRREQCYNIYCGLRNVKPEKVWLRYDQQALVMKEDHRSSQNDPMLYHFSHEGLACVVEEILRWDVDAINTIGGRYGTALQAAACQGHKEIIHMLLEKGADVKVQSGHFGNALLAAVLKCHEDTVGALLDWEADVNDPPWLLEIAVFNGNVRIVKMLLDKGALVTKATFKMVQKGSAETITPLLESFASSDTTANFGEAMPSSFTTSLCDCQREPSKGVDIIALKFPGSYPDQTFTTQPCTAANNHAKSFSLALLDTTKIKRNLGAKCEDHSATAKKSTKLMWATSTGTLKAITEAPNFTSRHDNVSFPTEGRMVFYPCDMFSMDSITYVVLEWAISELRQKYGAWVFDSISTDKSMTAWALYISSNRFIDGQYEWGQDANTKVLGNVLASLLELEADASKKHDQHRSAFDGKLGRFLELYGILLEKSGTHIWRSATPNQFAVKTQPLPANGLRQIHPVREHNSGNTREHTDEVKH